MPVRVSYLAASPDMGTPMAPVILISLERWPVSASYKAFILRYRGAVSWCYSALPHLGCTSHHLWAQRSRHGLRTSPGGPKVGLPGTETIDIPHAKEAPDA